MTEREYVGFDDSVAVMASAMDAGASPVAIADVVTLPPPPDHLLSLLRQMIEETGSAMGAIQFGTTAETGMLPLGHLGPQEGLALVIAARLAGVIASVTWVALAADAYHQVAPEGVSIDEATRYRNLGDGFEAGDSSITEALMVLCVAPDGPGFNKVQPYVRVNDAIEWGEPFDLDHEEQYGEVHRLMNMLVLA